MADLIKSYPSNLYTVPTFLQPLIQQVDKKYLLVMLLQMIVVKKRIVFAPKASVLTQNDWFCLVLS